MTHAYDKLYLEKARIALGRMLDFAVYTLGEDLTEFYNGFIESGVARDFGAGDITLLVGKSGVELAMEVMVRQAKPFVRRMAAYAASRSPEYWTGWALAGYQWETGLSFEEINSCIPITDVRDLYYPYHEMDIRQFYDRMSELYRQAKPDTNLKLLRKKAGLSQSELAGLSGIPVRSIQQYEQRQKNINKAQAEYVIALSRILCCRPEQLMEPMGTKAST